MDGAPAQPVDSVLPVSGDGSRVGYSPEALAGAQAPVAVEAPVAAGGPAQGGGSALKRAAVRSSMWTLTAFALAQVIRFGSVFFLQIFLLPDDFGVAATVGFFIVLLAALSDVGIEQSIIQNKRGDDPVFLNTAWTLHATRGVVLFVGSCLMAYPVFWFYQSKGEDARYLLWMIPVAGLGPLIGGFNSTSTFTLHRHMRQGLVTLFGLLYQIVAVIVTLGIAWKWRSPWAIIVGGLAAHVFYLAASHFFIRGYRNRFQWDKSAGAELMKFGKWIMISTLITYLAMQIDRAMIPKLLDFTWAGRYGIALSLVAMPREVIGRLASVSLFPLLSRAAEGHPEEIRRVLLRARGLILTASLACTLGVILVGPVFIVLFFKPEFHLAGLLTRLASIGGWFILLQVTADRALLAQGRTKPLATSNAVNLAVTVVGGLLGRWIEIRFLGHQDGIVGFMLGLAAGKLAGHLMIQMELARIGIRLFGQDAFYTALLLGLSVVGIIGPRLVPGYTGRETLYNVIAAGAVCTLTCGWAGLKVLRGIR